MSLISYLQVVTIYNPGLRCPNRISEVKLNEAEAFTSLAAAFSDGRYCNKTFADAWEKVLFNHFHDIIPGSGVIDTREYAMGKFQEVLAAANTETVNAFGAITANVNTAAFLHLKKMTRIFMRAGPKVPE